MHRCFYDQNHRGLKYFSGLILNFRLHERHRYNVLQAKFILQPGGEKPSGGLVAENRPTYLKSFSRLKRFHTLGRQIHPNMFIGHFAAGMAGKKLQPAISLGTFFLAAQFLDLLWPTLLLLDMEHVVIAPGTSAVTPLQFSDYPVSHSLLLVSGWGLLFGILYYLMTKNRSGALLLGALVVSHWILDLIVHIPDLPLYPGNSPKWGLGLWNSAFLTILVEGALFVAGILLYVRAKKNLGQKVSWWFWSLVLFLVVIHTMNFISPPPPNVTAIAWAGHLQWIFVIWAWWADRK